MSQERVIYEKTDGLTDVHTHFCSGCGHGIVHKLIGESLVELGVLDKSIGVAPVGCAAPSTAFFNCDMILADHGRAPALATGLKRALPDKLVFTYQGDGDIAAIGTSEIVQAANRAENISVFFVNNAIYAMTGGQMSPTSIIGQVTSTSPYGRKAEESGMPMKLSEMLAALDGVSYIERVAVNSPANTRQAKKAIKKSLENQLAGKGLSLVEILSTCPTNWGLDPVESLKWVGDSLAKYYPLGVIKDD